jgi:hypothetical protein
MSDRTWIDWPSNIRLETEFGPCQIAVICQDQVFVESFSGSFREGLTIRSCDLYISMHFQDDGHGYYKPYCNEHGQPQIHIMKRGLSGESAAPTFQAKVIAALGSRISEYLYQHPELRAAGALANANHALITAEQDYAKAEAAFLTARAARDEARARFRAAGGQD